MIPPASAKASDPALPVLWRFLICLAVGFLTALLLIIVLIPQALPAVGAPSPALLGVLAALTFAFGSVVFVVLPQIPPLSTSAPPINLCSFGEAVFCAVLITICCIHYWTFYPHHFGLDKAYLEEVRRSPILVVGQVASRHPFRGGLEIVLTDGRRFRVDASDLLIPQPSPGLFNALQPGVTVRIRQYKNDLYAEVVPGAPAATGPERP